MAEYNAQIIREHADKLYSKASSIVLTYTAGGAILSAALGYFIALVVLMASAKARGSQGADDVQTLFTIVGLFLGAVGGYWIGSEKAFSLRLQAQMALCQMKIEENTRPRSETTASEN